MDISQTIAAAAERFGVTVAQIQSGRSCRDPRVGAARWWIVGQFPDMSANSLAVALKYKSHASVLYVRKRLAKSIVND